MPRKITRPNINHNAVGVLSTAALEAPDKYVAIGDSDGDGQANDWFPFEDTVTTDWLDAFAEVVLSDIPAGVAEGASSQPHVRWFVTLSTVVLV